MIAIPAMVDHLPPLRAMLRRAVGHNWAELAMSAASVTIKPRARRNSLRSRTPSCAWYCCRKCPRSGTPGCAERATCLGTPAQSCDSPDNARPSALPDGPIEQYARRIST